MCSDVIGINCAPRDRNDERAPGLAPLIEAGNLGYAPAQLKLVGLYQTGEAGVPQDEAESRLWARKAAEGGGNSGSAADAPAAKK